MKKLMFALAAVAFAAVSQAAQVTWASGAITLPDGETKAGAGDVTAYLWVIDKTAYDKLADYTTSGEALSKAVWEAYGNDLASADLSVSSVKKGNKADLKDPNTYYTDGAAKNAYAAILYVDKAGENYMGNIGAYTFAADTDGAPDEFSIRIGGLGDDTTSTPTAWQSVPEPTSGLLLLLGVAGLALRRRRA